MFNSNSLPVQSIEAPEKQQKIDVMMDNSADGSGQLVMKLSTWTDGLGWCVQKTMAVDADQLDELQRTLTVARHRMHWRRAEAGNPAEPAKVIQMPVLG